MTPIIFSLPFIIMASSVISILFWIVALFRFRTLISPNDSRLFVGTLLAIISIIIIDAIVVWAFLARPSGDSLREAVAFAFGLQLVGAISVATSRSDKK